MPTWRLQIYRVSDPTSQELIAALLAGVDSLVVEATASDSDSYVVVEACDSQQAQGVLRLVRTIDPGVTLLHTSTPRSTAARAA
jgi:hypothetical protein